METNRNRKRGVSCDNLSNFLDHRAGYPDTTAGGPTVGRGALWYTHSVWSTIACTRLSRVAIRRSSIHRNLEGLVLLLHGNHFPTPASLPENTPPTNEHFY